jgi:NitT/TauT family transport system substrate-binding protein
LKEVKQLGDKMVAMTRYSATDFLTDHVLTGVKTTATVYRVQINDVPLRLQMLLNNEMDALWLPEPQATTAREHGHTVLWDTEKHNLWLGRVVFRDKALGDARVKKQIDVFKQAYNMACDSLNQRGVSAYADLVVKYCQTDQKTLDALPKVKFRKL